MTNTTSAGAIADSSTLVRHDASTSPRLTQSRCEEGASFVSPTGQSEPGFSVLEEAQRVVEQLCSQEQWVIAATANALLVGYDATWRADHEQMQLDRVESELVGPLVSIDPPLKSAAWQIGGRLDKIVRDGHGLCLYDHKTTSQPIENPNGFYWRQLQVDAQHQHYELVGWLNGIKFDRIVWDVVHKPSIRPRRLSKAERNNLASSGSWHGTLLSAEAVEDAIRTGRENVELFGARATAEVLSRPQKYFARRNVVRSRPELADYANELYQVGQSLEEARRLGHHYRNPSACWQYGGPCEFLEICSGHDREDSDKWQRTQAVHRELETIEEGGDLLTHSRVQCFLACRRKHYFRYELGLDPVEPIERDALFFGQVWHEALDVYWRHSCRNAMNH